MLSNPTAEVSLLVPHPRPSVDLEGYSTQAIAVKRFCVQQVEFPNHVVRKRTAHPRNRSFMS